MKSKSWFISIVLLAMCILAAPRRASADTVSIVEEIFDAVHQAKPDIPSGSDLDSLIRCLADPSQNIAICAQAAGADSPYAQTVADLYTAVASGNFGDIVSITVQWLEDDAPCIILDILTGGAGGSLCDLVKEVVEVLSDIGGAIVEFLEDVGEAVADAVDDIGCTLGLGGCSDSSPPDKVAYAWVYAPEINAGTAAIEGIGAPTDYSSKKYDNLLKQLRAQASANPAQLNIQMFPALTLTFPSWAVDNAEKVYEGVVGAHWNADMVTTPNGILWQTETIRGNYLNDQTKLQQLASAAVFQDLPSDWIAKQCTNDLRQTLAVVVDRWVSDQFNVYEQYVPTSDVEALQSIRGKTPPNSSWCQSTYVGQHGPKEFTDYFRSYINSYLCPKSGAQLVCASGQDYGRCSRILYSVSQASQMAHECTMKPPDCPMQNGKYVCTQQGYDYCKDWASASGAQIAQCTLQPPACKQYAGVYYCSTLDNYAYCGEWAASVGMPASSHCSIDTSQLGPQAAQTIKSYLDTLSPHQCVIGGNALARAVIQNQAGSMIAPNVRNMAGVIAPQAGTSAKPAQAAASVPVQGLGGAPDTNPTVLACPRIGLEKACEKRQGDLYSFYHLPFQLVDCEYHPDAAYAKQIAEVAAAYNALGSKLAGMSYVNRSGVADQDPLVVWAADPSIFKAITDACANMNFFSVPPSSKPTFVALTSLQEPIDGVATPTVFFDQDAWSKKINNRPLTTPANQFNGQIQINPITQSKGAQIVVSPEAQAKGGFNEAAASQAIATQKLNPQVASSSSNMQVMDATRPTPRSNFGLLVQSWKSVKPVQEATPSYNCSLLLMQIRGIEQRSNALINEGQALATALDSGKLNPAETQRANQRLQEINPQLYNNLQQREQLVEQYNKQLNGVAPQIRR
jgi:hypothetical protein